MRTKPKDIRSRIIDLYDEFGYDDDIFADKMLEIFPGLATMRPVDEPIMAKEKCPRCGEQVIGGEGNKYVYHFYGIGTRCPLFSFQMTPDTWDVLVGEMRKAFAKEKSPETVAAIGRLKECLAATHGGTVITDTALRVQTSPTADFSNLVRVNQFDLDTLLLYVATK